MAASNISTLLSNIDINTYLKIYQMNGFTRNLSDSSEMWAHIKKYKEMDPQARSIKYLLVDELGYASIQAAAADGSTPYPAAQRSGLQEPEALYKEWHWTVDVPRVLQEKTGSELMQYAMPLATELDNKQIAFARLKCIELQGDGSGTIGLLNGAASYASNQITLTISNTSASAGRSFVRWFQEGDAVKVAAPDSTARLAANAGGNNVTQLKVVSIDDENNQVVLEGFAASDSDTTITGVGTIADGDYVYRIGTTPNDLSSIAIDYAKLSEVMVGLESLMADDGRTVNGVAHTGAIKGTRKDLSGAVIDSKHFQQLLSKLKRKAGQGRYTYSKAFMADEVLDSLVESRETDRRFHDISDTDRGVKGIGYVHGRDRVEFVADEFVPSQRIRLIPDQKEALCYIGRDPVQVAPNGNDPYHLSQVSGGSGYGKSTQTFFEQTGVIVAKHAAGLGTIENFTVSE